MELFRRSLSHLFVGYSGTSRMERHDHAAVLWACSGQVSVVGALLLRLYFRAGCGSTRAARWCMMRPWHHLTPDLLTE